MTDARSLAEMAADEKAANAPMTLEANRRRTRAGFVPKVLKFAGKIPFSEDLASTYYAASDRLTPTRVKGVLYAALAYFVVPTDLVPDFIAALGFTDDATVLATALGYVGSHIQPRHRRAARRLLDRPEPPVPTDSDVEV